MELSGSGRVGYGGRVGSGRVGGLGWAGLGWAEVGQGGLGWAGRLAAAKKNPGRIAPAGARSPGAPGGQRRHSVNNRRRNLE